MDYVDIGGTPHEEVCAALGVTENAEKLSRLECRAYIVALKRKYGEPPEGACFTIHGNEHEFGTYYEARCLYDPSIKAAADYAFKTESGLATWDEVGMWAPVKYDGTNPIHILRDEALWLKEMNPLAYNTLERLAAEAPA